MLQHLLLLNKYLASLFFSCSLCRVGRNRIYAPYMTVYLVISLPKIPYIHRIYKVLANPISLFFCKAPTQHESC